jgi:hypothetical protein
MFDHCNTTHLQLSHYFLQKLLNTNLVSGQITVFKLGTLYVPQHFTQLTKIVLRAVRFLVNLLS